MEPSVKKRKGKTASSQSKIAISRTLERIQVKDYSRLAQKQQDIVSHEKKEKRKNSSTLQKNDRGNPEDKGRIHKQTVTKTGKVGRYYAIRQDFEYLLKEYHYKVVKQIGRGGYGVVYKAYNTLSEQRYRVTATGDSSTVEEQYRSQASKQHASQSQMPLECAIKINFNTISREVVFSEMAFLHLVKLNKCKRLPIILDAFVHDQIAHVVIKHEKHTPYIACFNKFEILDIKHYLLQLLFALQELKNLGVYHRDIKPANFLYNPSTKRGILIDFGIAEVSETFMKNFWQEVRTLKRDLKSIEEVVGDRVQLTTQPRRDIYLQKKHAIKTKLKQLQPLIDIYGKLEQCRQIISQNKVGTEVYMPLQTLLRDNNQPFQTQIWAVGVIFLQFITRKYNIFNIMLTEDDIVLLKQGGLKKNGYLVEFILKLQSLFGTQKVKRVCSRLGYNLNLPFRSAKTQVQFKDMAIVSHFDKVAEDLLSKMLELFVDQRISVQEAIQHPFFDEIRQYHTQTPSSRQVYEDFSQL